MDIFLKQARQSLLMKESMLIGKIRKESGGWTIFSSASRPDEVFISSEYYQGKMPPSFHFPWKALKLEFVRVNGYVLEASMNGELLYKLSEEEFPEAVISYIEQMAEILQSEHNNIAKRETEVSEALKIYLVQIAVDPDLENKIFELPVCFRAFLQMHLLVGAQSEDAFKRLTLLYQLCDIANRIRRRYHTHLYGVHAFPFGFHFDDWKLSDEQLESRRSLYKLSPQVISVMNMVLPPVEHQLLKRYLVCEVKRLIADFVADSDTLEGNYSYDPWMRRSKTDSEDYAKCWQKMKLPKFETLLLPDELSEEQKNYFFKNYCFE